MDEQTTSVSAGAPTSGGDSPANSSVGDLGATTSTSATGAESAVAAVEALLAEQQPATTADATATTAPKQDATTEAKQGAETPALDAPLDEQSFSTAPKDRQVQAFIHQRQQIQQLEQQTQQFKADSDLLGLAFGETPAQFWDQITDASPAAAINLLEAVITEAPEVVVDLLQKAGKLPAVDPNQATAAIQASSGRPDDLPAELHEIWNTLSQELRDEMALMTPALRDRWLEKEKADFQAGKAKEQAAVESAEKESQQRLAQYEESVWQAVMQQVEQEVPLTGDKQADAQIYRLAALAAYYDLMPKDPTTMSLVSNVKSWLSAGEKRNYEGAQIALIAAGKAATVKALDPIVEAFRKAAKFDQLQREKANPRLPIDGGNGNGAGETRGQSLNGLTQQERLAAIAQSVSQTFNLPA